MFFDYKKKEKTKLDDYTWIKDGKLYLLDSDWINICSNFDKKEILKHIAKVIHEQNIKFPYREYNISYVRDQFSKLRNTNINPLKEKWKMEKTQLDCPLLYKNEYVMIPRSSLGNYVSDFFMQKERYKAKGKGKPKSMVECWDEMLGTGELDKERCLRAIFMKDFFRGKEFLLRSGQMTGLIVGQFRPSTAKALYDFFDAKNVLDFCAGWGDRLAGFNASNAETYIGIDPNSKLHEPYKQIHDFCNTGKKATFICSPAEDVDYSELKYDFVFTSPPYFDVEIYTSEETQSIEKFNTLDLWLEGFLLTTLSKIYEGLDEGGRIAINIADNKKKKFVACNTIISHMETLGATFEGVLGYKIQKRPSQFGMVKNSPDDNDFSSAEPIMVWSKGKAKDPKWNQDNYFGV